VKSAVILGRVSTQEKGPKERRFWTPCQSCGKDLTVALVYMYEPYCRACAFPKIGPAVPMEPLS
jgi:hypothetical protein